MKILVAGVFDQLHVGHQYLLWHAATLGDECTVIIARDQNVLRYKNELPIQDEATRLRHIEEQHLPHTTVRLGRSDGDIRKAIAEESPDMILLGYDQTIDEAAIVQTFPRVEIQHMNAYHPAFFKSSYFRYNTQE